METALIRSLMDKDFYDDHRGIKCPDKLFGKDLRSLLFPTVENSTLSTQVGSGIHGGGASLAHFYIRNLTDLTMCRIISVALIFLSNCSAPGTALLGPAFTGVTTKSVSQASLSFGTNQIVRKVNETGESVLLWLYNYKPDVTLLKDHRSKPWMYDYTKAPCKYMLGEARSKYTSGLPGAGGAIQLNGETLKTEAQVELDKLQEAIIESQLLDNEFANMADPLGRANVGFGHPKRKRSGHSQKGLCACKQCLVADVLQKFFMVPRGSQ